MQKWWAQTASAPPRRAAAAPPRPQVRRAAPARAPPARRAGRRAAAGVPAYGHAGCPAQPPCLRSARLAPRAARAAGAHRALRAPARPALPPGPRRPRALPQTAASPNPEMALAPAGAPATAAAAPPSARARSHGGHGAHGASHRQSAAYHDAAHRAHTLRTRCGRRCGCAPSRCACAGARTRRFARVRAAAVARRVPAACRSADALRLRTPFATPSQNLIFRFLQSKQRIQIWLYENTDTRIEGRIIVRTPRARAQGGPRSARQRCCRVQQPQAHRAALTWRCCAHAQGFDEYMNLVVDDAEELSLKKKSRKQLGALRVARSRRAGGAHLGACLSDVACAWPGRIMLKGDNITLMQTAKAA